MTRIIALSDTHLENESLPPAVAALAGSADIILHAGDFVSAKCHSALGALGRLEAVHGNSDSPELKKLLPERKVIDYNRETLEVKYKGKSIAEVLDMTVEEAGEHFQNVPAIKSKLDTLLGVGLGYIKLGQSSTTLSGGEAQRIKLTRELAKRGTGRTIYLLDEPTTGLHFADVRKLISVLDDLVGKGNSVVVIEHNLDVIKCADYIIDMGPEGGNAGGRVVAAGTPEEVALVEESHTGRYLKSRLKGNQ